MPATRVLIVDDAVVVRRLVTDSLSGDPEIEVVGAAANGRIALAKIPQVNPDIIILDIEMPEMDGLQMLEELRVSYPGLPVIMFSMLTKRGAIATLDALSLGATDYVTKPSNLRSTSEAVDSVRSALVPRIKALCGVEKRRHRSPASRASVITAPDGDRPPHRPQRIDIVAIGVSTGGPNALALVLSSIPKDFPVPIVIVQHMPPLFTSFLAERLATHCDIDVREAVSGEALHPGCAWLAPGDYHMIVERRGKATVLGTHKGPPENSCRPSVDVLFRSVVANYGPNALAVVMTGMGQDGLRGCEQVHEAGGQVVVQDEATSVVWGMPGFVAKAGLADGIIAVEQLGEVMIERVELGRSRSDSPGIKAGLNG